MNALRHIRCKVFRVTQIEMAKIAGVRQATISRWEAGIHAPSLPQLGRIREEALRRKLPWDDRWFFSATIGRGAAA